MNVYTYQAALLCERCARSVLLKLNAEQSAADPDAKTFGELPQHASTADLCRMVHDNGSGRELPDGPFPDGGGAADCPQHCDKCQAFLQNDLTDAGEAWLKQTMADAVTAGRITGTVHQWAQFYGLRFDDAPRAALLDDAERLKGFLLLAGACKPAREWAQGRTLRQAWAECEDADWMRWWLETAGVDYTAVDWHEAADVRRHFPDPVTCQPVPAVPAGKCECRDPGCKCCGGKCERPSATLLQRIDMEDDSGVALCYGCGTDAMESGLFTDVRGDTSRPAPEWEEQSYEHHGLPVFEHDGETFAYAADDDAADAAAKEAARDSLWAFNSEFLSGYIPALRNTRARVAFDKMREALCEDASELVAAMLGDNIDRMLQDAIGADGRGHFLASYDSEERDAEGRPGFTYRL